MGITQSEQQKEMQVLLNKNNLTDVRNNIKHICINIIRVPEEEREKGIKNVSNGIMAESIQSLKKKTYPCTGSTRNSKQDEPKQTQPRHIIDKVAKVKHRECPGWEDP